MPRIIGIDLGTTNTAVAVMEAGRPRVIEDERGYKVLPSVISAKGEGKFVVGQAAHNLILTRPDRTVYATKRLIGRRYDSVEVQEAIRRVNYKVRPAPDGGVEMQVGDQWMSPTEVAAVVLQVAKTIAEKALGERIEEAVISVPAYFNHAQRKATIEAAEMAGLRCDRLLHEPTAAALAFGHRKNIDRTILIFDLGGGTFDVSVLRLSSGIYETLSTLGDSYLGGEDVDSRVVDFIVGMFRDRSGVDLTNDRNAVQRIRDAAERAKCELSFADRATIVIPHVTPQHSIDFVLTRSKLEEITADLISRCIDVTRRAVIEGGLKLAEVDEVILVGGQTRMPRLREAVTELLGREPSRTVHPEEAVAIGAAVHAANLADGDQSRTVLLDVTPFDLGLDGAGGLFVPVVHRNSRVPSSETRTFATANDNQESVRVTVRQGESRNSTENEFLGEFVLDGLTPAPRMQTKVDVNFRVDGNGMLHVSAVEKGSGERKNITIRNYAEHAATPHMPTPAEVKAEDERARRAVAQSLAPVGPAKKVGLFEGILGAFRKAPAEPKKPAPPSPPARSAAPGAVTAAPADAASVAAAAALAAAALAAAALAAPATAAAGATDGLATPPVPPPAALPDRVEPTPVTPELDEASEPLAYESGILMEEDSASPPVDPDELFALEGDDGIPFNLGGDDAVPAESIAEPIAESIAEPIAEPISESIAEAIAEPIDGPIDDQSSGGEAEEAVDDAPTPNGDDTAVTRRGWAWSDPESPSPRRTKPVDLGPDPFSSPAAEPAPTGRRPARVRLRYPDASRLGEEYRENLRKGGTFIKTPKPLLVGRECVCEVSAPGLDEPLLFPAVVTFVV
ncbi:MAG: hypothetical protein EXR69_10230, partial [Myxococcales bacterium]|nr:hypothetical protein [Myxococcales bacterium]